MPRHRINKTTKSYPPEAITDALQDMKQEGITLNQAVRKYNVPRSTLYQRINRSKKKHKGMPRAIPLEDEKNIADGLNILTQWGFKLKRKDIFNLVSDYIRLKYIKTPFKYNRPGADWFIYFKQRHQVQIATRPAKGVPQKEPTGLGKVNIYFDMLENYTNAFHLRERPQMIWNLVEINFSKELLFEFLNSNECNVVASVENITVLVGANATGKKLSPLIVFKGESVDSQWMAETGDDFEMTYAASSTGQVEAEVFLHYVENIVLPSINHSLPALIVYDGNPAHIDIEVSRMLTQKEVTVVPLPPDTTGHLQPLDIVVFKSFRDKWNALLQDWQTRNIGAEIPKCVFSQMLADIWNETDVDVIKYGFEKAGIFPLNPQVASVFEKTETDPY